MVHWIDELVVGFQLQYPNIVGKRLLHDLDIERYINIEIEPIILI